MDISTKTTGTISACSRDYTHDEASDNATQNPTSAFHTPGIVTAALKFTNSSGCINSLKAVVNIWGHKKCGYLIVGVVAIYYTDGIYKGWNWKVQNKNAIVQQDVYIWKVKLKDVLSEKHEYVGQVTLLK